MMRRVLRLFPYAVLVATAVAAAWPILRAPGMPYNVDISGFFPLTPDAYEGRFWPLWNERGGMATLQFLPGLLFELPLLVLGRLLGFDMEAHLKVRVVLGFALAGCAMHALARHYLARRPGVPAGALVLAPLAAGMLYMLNPWSVHRVFHYFLWIGYAMTPLVVLAFERLAESPTWRRALVLAGVVALGTTDPHNPATFALVLVPLAALRLAPLLRRDRAAALRLVRAAALAAGAFLALAAYWVLPYAYNAIHNPGFGPTYVMSDQMLGTLSRNGGFGETLRLLHNYLPRGDLSPAGGPALQAWLVASYAVPLLAASALALDRSRVAWTYGALAAVTLLLGMGSRGPFPGAYHWLLFDAPWGEGLSWLFRDPYRWGGLQALAYGVLLALALGVLSRVLARVRVPSAAPAVGLAVALVFAGPALASYVTGAYAPVVVPGEYAEANAWLAASPADAGVVWMPRALGATTWSGERTLAYFDATSSARPALGPFRPHTSTYFELLKDAAKDGAPLAPLLARAGADRVLYHNDVDAATGARAMAQLEALGLPEAARFGDSATLVVDASSLAPPHTPAARYALHGDREASQSFVPAASSLARLTLRVDDAGAPGPLRVAIVDADGREAFAANATMRADDKEVQVPLRGLRLTPGEPHELRLRALAPSGPRDHYNVSYYKVDAYPEGAFANATGDLAFDFLAHARGFAAAFVADEPAPRVRAAPAVASPGGLQTLRALETLPREGALRDAPVLFLNADDAARRAYAAREGPWSWVGGLEDGAAERVTPLLPASSFLRLLDATTNADAKAGWARGTQDFTYYEWGWKRALSAAGQESWDFDGADGLLYASVRANVTLPLDAGGEPAVVLARLHESAKGGNLSFHADGPRGGALVGRVPTRADAAAMRWVEVGASPAGATSLRVENEGGLQGVDAIAVVPRGAYDEALAEAAARMAEASVTLLAQAETVPGLGARTVHVAGVGRVAEVAKDVVVTVEVPAAGAYALFLRVPQGAAAPNVTLDGARLASPACEADCASAAGWLAVHAGRLDAGAHALRLAPGPGRTQVDALALTSDPGFADGRPPPVAWTRVSATEYRASLDGKGGLLALAVPYDAGWVARTDAGERVRSVPVDGVANGFLLPEGTRGVVLSYEPQAWAGAGVLVALLAALACLGATLAAAGSRRARAPAPVSEEVFP
ncbi:MAG TPA: hypothetical protein VNX21_04675 [Candidatus Thermoplasmatota archaeon]|nr:hypothetical protein [Candidatus Thermoplasmatota archaeon]